MFRWVIIQMGWLLVIELTFYGVIYSTALAVIVSSLDKLGERK